MFEQGLDLSKLTEDVRVSVLNALEHGFIKYESSKSKSYPSMLNPTTNLKWIHYIEQLKKNLRVTRFEDLENRNYDVATYYLYNATEYEKQTLDYFRWSELHSSIPVIASAYIKIHTLTQCEPKDFRDDVKLKYPLLNIPAFNYASQEDVINYLIGFLYKKLEFNPLVLKFLKLNGANSEIRLKCVNAELIDKLNRLKEITT